MATQKISLLEKKPLEVYECQRCKERTRRNKFIWRGWFDDDEIEICRDCAYREAFGSKYMKQAKKENKLEK